MVTYRLVWEYGIRDVATHRTRTVSQTGLHGNQRPGCDTNNLYKQGTGEDGPHAFQPRLHLQEGKDNGLRLILDRYIFTV